MPGPSAVLSIERVCRLRHLLIAEFERPLGGFSLDGPTFSAATPIQVIHSWRLVFVFNKGAGNCHLQNERETRRPLRFTIWGLVLVMVLSLILIPRYHGIGAARAVLVSYGVSAFGSSFYFSFMRSIGRKQLLASVTPWRAYLAVAPKEAVLS